jgi:hypothetical protein
MRARIVPVAEDVEVAAQRAPGDALQHGAVLEPGADEQEMDRRPGGQPLGGLHHVLDAFPGAVVCDDRDGEGLCRHVELLEPGRRARVP